MTPIRALQASAVLPQGLARTLHPLAPVWSNRNQIPAFSLRPLWRDWLFDQGSLTARISALRPGTFHVEVLGQYAAHPTATERRTLNLGQQQAVWVREVILRLADEPIVYARTAVPMSTLRGSGAQLRHLGNRSLGSFLFRQPGLKRTPLQVSHCAANQLGLQWARRSVFTLRGGRLLVTEAFSSRLDAYV
ncbi:chorismate--pyruvate lyase family protein [Thalassolituus sp. LLYu03]|uniref:chorismate--pyruvate lyase family protein n=1 Tax=Thalassolituus sp. LLYu03 TaxID=3421656 RepID=UPI003D27566D